MDPIKQLGWSDWLFVLLSWLTTWWLTFIVIELGNPGSAIGFDVMPVTAGATAIPVAWRALRVRERVETAIRGLDDGAGISVPDDESLRDFRNDVQATVLFWTNRMGFGIASVMLTGYLYAYHSGGLTAGRLGLANQLLTVILGIVMCGAGFVIGAVVGPMVGYGQLHRFMARHKVTLSGLATPEARAAMRGLEGVYGFAVLLTMMLCQWFGGWLFLWHIGVDPKNYADLWSGLFTVLWVISFTLYLVTALVPLRAFQRWLEPLYGGLEGRNALDQQLVEAERDRNVLLRAVEAGNWRRRGELADIERFIQDISERRFRSVLLRRELLYGFGIWNVASVIGPWLLQTMR
jgi:hypothetical protein